MSHPPSQAPSVTPAPGEIEAARRALGDAVLETPVHAWRGPEIAAAGPQGATVLAKLELFQVTGTFKARGALTNLLRMSEADRKRGVTAVSAGNHAIAVAYAARALGSSAKVVMPKSAPPFRRARAESYGAEVILTENIAEAFETGLRIQEQEGRTLIHPFEGANTVLGTATVGWELCRQAAARDFDLDAVIVPVGGGGLIAGVAAAVKQLRPDCRVYGVEPEGAPAIRRSLDAGKPVKIDAVATIADSLGAPYATPGTFAMIQRHVDDVVLVDDTAIRRAMRFVFDNLKLAVEPACAAGTAALTGPLKERLAGQRIGLVFCGTNIGHDTFCKHLADAE
ncbi:MAG: threonine/serine dehydratase [Rhodovibrionaceae bacterium]